MASMSGNYSTHSLMGFSVHQPALGAALQFFPAMGSEQLDEMIDAYIPGSASILDKRTAVSLEFFDHTLQTGELFKFFLVYPAVSSNTASPASTMQDSGYGSSFNTSPVMNDSLWKQTTSEWPFSSSSKKARTPSKKASPSSSQAKADFSHIPGMKIMTKDGLDVTNAASRGCKTKEQRDHAHLMRIIKACDACKRKKTRCDPSHKKRGSSVAASPEPRVSKKVKKATAPSAQKSPAFKADIQFATTFDPIIADSYSFDASFMTAPDQAMNDWDQYIKYDEEVNDVIPQDYDFFSDPARYFSPTATDNSHSASASSSQILTPGQSQPVTPTSGLETVGGVDFVGADLVGLGDGLQPALPYLHRDGVEVGNNYVDFALYSPGSSCLDDEPALSKEISAARNSSSSHYQQVSSNRKPDVRSSLHGGVATPPQATQADQSAFALGSANSVLVQPGLGQSSDQGHFDRSYDRDQRAQQSSRQDSVASSYTGVPANPVEQRVPGVTVLPSDTLLGLPPSGLQTQPIAPSSVAAAFDLAEPIKRKSSRLPPTTTSAMGDEPVTVHGLSSTERTSQPLVTAPTLGTPGIQVSPSVEPGSSGEQRLVRSVDRRRPTNDFRHQRLPNAIALDRAGDSAIHVGTTVAAQRVSSATVGFTNGATSGAANAFTSNGTVRNVLASQIKTSYSGTDIIERQTASVAATAIHATSSPLTGFSAGIQPGLLPVSGLLAVSDAIGHKASVSVHGGNTSTSVFSILALLAVLSKLVAIAVVLCYGRSIVWSLAGHSSAPLFSASLLALSTIATSSQRSPVSCMNKLDPFTQALSVTRQVSGHAIGNVKSQIHGVQCKILSFQRRAQVGRGNMSRPAHLNGATARLGMVY